MLYLRFLHVSQFWHLVAGAPWLTLYVYTCSMGGVGAFRILHGGWCHRIWQVTACGISLYVLTYLIYWVKFLKALHVCLVCAACGSHPCIVAISGFGGGCNPRLQFDCGDDYCIPLSWRCDSDYDCPVVADSGVTPADEVNCKWGWISFSARLL